MCLIVIKPPGKSVYRSQLHTAFHNNSDGAGFMFNADGKVHVLKGWFGFRKFYKTFRRYERAFPESTFVLHMRIGTSGKKDVANCHPFAVNDHAGFVHNGVMIYLGDTERSDTMVFVEEVLQKLPENFYLSPVVLQEIENCAVHSSSKFALLLGDGSTIRFNEPGWHDDKGCWYSNSSYKSLSIISRHAGLANHYTGGKHYNYIANDSRCAICYDVVSDKNIGYQYSHHLVCKECLDRIVYVIYIHCTACYSAQALSYPMLRAEHPKCEFCGAVIEHDDIMWELMRFSGVSYGNV